MRLKCFPDRRGLAAHDRGRLRRRLGAHDHPDLRHHPRRIGYEAAFLYFGIAQGADRLPARAGLLTPRTRSPNGVEQPLNVQQSQARLPPSEVLSSPLFWVMYAMFVMVAAGGLMATAQLAPIAKDFKIVDVPVSIMGLVLPALTFALAIDRVLNGLTRPFFGWVPSLSAGRRATRASAARRRAPRYSPRRGSQRRAGHASARLPR